MQPDAGVENYARRLAAAQAKVEHVVDDIRGVMRTAGYADGDYRLVLQSYAAVIPAAKDARYPETGPERTIDGCPFYNADMDWGHNVAGPAIGGMVKAAAAATGAEFMDVGHAFDGHEFCAKSDADAAPLAFPSPAGAEWPGAEREYDQPGRDPGGVPPRRLRPDGP